MLFSTCFCMSLVELLQQLCLAIFKAELQIIKQARSSVTRFKSYAASLNDDEDGVDPY